MNRDELETIVYQHMPRVGPDAILHYNVASIMAAVDQYVVTLDYPAMRRALLDHAVSRRANNRWPLPAGSGAVYVLHYEAPIGNPRRSGRNAAQHYTGFALEQRLGDRIDEHATGQCGVRICLAFWRAGIKFQVARIEHGVTRARENSLKLHGARRHCPVCQGRPAVELWPPKPASRGG